MRCNVIKKFLRLFWATSVLAILIVAFSITKSQAQSGDVDPVKHQLFDLSDVELLDSPFKKAMQLDGKYLLKLEADRLLAPYLEEAGLEAKAEHYGGWEAEGEMGEGLDGHSLGHYLSALSMIYASTGNEKFGDRLNYVVNELARAQQANENGYVGGVPNGEEILNEVRSGKINAEPFALNGSWVPWYNLHKLFAGLRDAYRHAGNEQALDILIKLSDWTVDWADNLSEQQFQEVLKTEHGGMKEVMADLYAITGKKSYLDLAQRFTHKSVIDPLAKREDQLEGLHANTQIPKIVGAARQYEVSGDEEMREVSRFFWETVVNNRTYANGGNSDHEHFGPQGGIISERLSRWSSETCNTYNMLKLTRHLTQWEAHPRYADYYERALYNHILASQDPQTGMFAYYMSMEPGFYKTFSKPFHSFWCCVGSGMENHTKYGRYIYMHSEKELYVNLFIPSELQWEEKGITLRQETEFPEDEQSTFIIQTDQSKEFALQMRRPYWAGKKFSIAVNGEQIPVEENPSSYISIDRRWENGDTVSVTLPMDIHTEQLGNNPNKIAFLKGPILLAGIVGTNVPIPGQYGTDQYEFFELPTVDVPSLQPESSHKQELILEKGGLEFEFQHVGAANGIVLAPYYEVNHDYYNIYWDVEAEGDE